MSNVKIILKYFLRNNLIQQRFFILSLIKSIRENHKKKELNCKDKTDIKSMESQARERSELYFLAEINKQAKK